MITSNLTTKGVVCADWYLYAQRAAHRDGGRFESRTDGMYVLKLPGLPAMLFTTDREVALKAEEINLLGLEHPTIQSWLDKFSRLSPEARGVRVSSPEAQHDGFLTIWQVVVQAAGGQVNQRVVRLGIAENGERSTQLERLGKDLLSLHINETLSMNLERMTALVNGTSTEMLRRDLAHAGVLSQEASFSKQLIGLLEVVRWTDSTSNQTDSVLI